MTDAFLSHPSVQPFLPYPPVSSIKPFTFTVGAYHSSTRPPKVKCRLETYDDRHLPFAPTGSTFPPRSPLLLYQDLLSLSLALLFS